MSDMKMTYRITGQIVSDSITGLASKEEKLKTVKEALEAIGLVVVFDTKLSRGATLGQKLGKRNKLPAPAINQ